MAASKEIEMLAENAQFDKAKKQFEVIEAKMLDARKYMERWLASQGAHGKHFH